MVVIITTPQQFKLQIERALGYEKGSRPVNLSICLRQCTGKGLHTVQGLVGYCRKAKDTVDFREITHKITDQDKTSGDLLFILHGRTETSKTKVGARVVPRDEGTVKEILCETLCHNLSFEKVGVGGKFAASSRAALASVCCRPRKMTDLNKHDAHIEWEIPDTWGTQPPPLCGHTLSILNRKAYLIGGCGPIEGSTAVFDHLYSLDLVTWRWTKLNPTLFGCSQSSENEDIHSALKMFGFDRKLDSGKKSGIDELTHSSDKDVKDEATYAREGTAKKGPEISPPQARWKHTTAVIGKDHLMVFGGIGPDDDSSRLGDLWILDLSEQTAEELQKNGSASSPKLDILLQADDAIKVLDTYEAQRVSALNLNSIQPPVMPASQHTDGTDHPPIGPDSFSVKIKLSDQLEPVWIRPRSDPVSAPSPRSHHSAVCHKGKMWIFGGYGGEKQARLHLSDLICLHAHDERAPLWEYDELLEWTRPEVYGTPPRARSGHAACTVENIMIISGGRNLNGLLADAHVFNFDSDTWSTLKDALFMEVPAMSMAATEHPGDENSDDSPLSPAISDVPLFQVASASRPQTKPTTSPARPGTTMSGVSRVAGVGLAAEDAPQLPMKVCNHLCEALDSVPSYKFFVFGGQTHGDGERDASNWRYCADFNIMDCASKSWMSSKVGGKHKPTCREDAAWAYDTKTARLILYGGWSDAWLSDLYNLDVSGIVGPPYAVSSIEPTSGPVTGNTLIIIQGINFYFLGDNEAVKVKFTSPQHEKIVDGKLISPAEIRVYSPSWESVGANEVDVRVSLGGETFTVNRIRWGFYVNTMPQKCLAYGPGILSTFFWGLPAKFRIQARDSTSKNRTSGLDLFEVTVRRRLPEPDNPDDDYDADGKKIEFEDVPVQIEDSRDGSYEVTYLPTIVDSEYVINVSLNGIAIRGSPWTVLTEDPWVHSIKTLSPSNAPREMENVRYSIQGSKLVVFGGSTSAIFVFDLQSFRWDSPTVASELPQPRRGHTMVALDQERTIIFHGNTALVGGVEQYCDDINILSGDKTGWRWTRALMHPGSDKPPLRRNAAACLLPGDKPGSRRIVVNGGLSHDGSLLSDTYILEAFNVNKMEWINLKNVVHEAYLEEYYALMQKSKSHAAGSGVFAMKAAQEQKPEHLDGPMLPGARQEHQIFPLEKDSVVIFGGRPFSVDVIIGEIKDKIGIVEWRVAKVGGDKPTPRRDFHSSVNLGELLLYGGIDSNGKPLDDIFMLDTKVEESKWKWQCLYKSDTAWMPKNRERSLGFLSKGKLVAMLGAISIDNWGNKHHTSPPCEDTHILEYHKLLDSTSVFGKMATQIVGDIANAHRFLKNEYDVLSKEMPSAAESSSSKSLDGDEIELRSRFAWEIFGSLYRIQQNTEELSLTLDVLEEVLAALCKNSGSKLERLGQDLTDCVEMWREIQKLVPRIREKTQWLRAIETVKLRENIAALDEKVIHFNNNLKRRVAFNFTMNYENAFQDISEIFINLLDLNNEAEELHSEATIFEFPEQLDLSLTKLRDMGESLVGVRQIWCFIMLYDSYLSSWGQTKWHSLDSVAAETHFSELMELLMKLMEKNPAQRNWDLFLELRLNMNNLITTIRILRNLQGVYFRDRHWEFLKKILKVLSLPYNDENFMIQNLLSFDLYTLEEDIDNLLLRARSEHQMEGILAEIRALWSDAEFRFDQNETLKSMTVSLQVDLFEKLETHRIQVATLMNSKFLDAVLREDKDGSLITFEKEVKYWDSELSLVAEAVQLCDELQGKWKTLDTFFLKSRDVPKALPEAAEKFKVVDQQIREFLAELYQIKKVTAASSQDFVLSIRLEAYREKLEEAEEALLMYARKKRKAFPPFYLLSLAEVLTTLSNEIKAECSFLDFKKIRSSISHINIFDNNGIVTASSWVSYDGTEKVDFITEVALECSLISDFKTILAQVGQTLFELLRQAIEAVVTAADMTWCLEYPNQVTLCATRVHFYSYMERELENFANGDKEAVERVIKTQQAHNFECITMLHSQPRVALRTILQNLLLLQLHMCDLADSFKMQEPGGPKSFAWKYQIRVQWRLDTGDADNPFAENQEDNTEQADKINCFLQCGDRSYRYLHDYLGPIPGAVITISMKRAFINAIQALTAHRGCLVLSEAHAGKTETVRELATLAGTHIEVIHCTPQMNVECLTNILCGLTSNCAWGCLRNFHTLPSHIVGVVAVLCKGILLAQAEHRKTCSIGHFDNMPLNSAFGFFILWPSSINSISNCPHTVHPAIKAQIRPVFISEPDFDVVLRYLLTAKGFRNAEGLSVKLSHVAQFGRKVLKGARSIDWGLRTFKRLINICFKLRVEGRWGESSLKADAMDELALFQREIVLYFEGIVDKDSYLVLREFVCDIFRQAIIEVSSTQSRKMKRMATVMEETCIAKLRCTDMAVEQIVDLEEILNFSRAVALTGATASGKSHIWKSLARALETRGVRVSWKQINPKVFTPSELYGHMSTKAETVVEPQTEIWKDGILPLLLKDLMARVEFQHRWLLIDCEMDPSWAENMQSLFDDKGFLSLANNEQIRLTPQTAIMMEMKSLRYAAPSTVSRLALLNVVTALDWENLMEMWIVDSNILQNRRDCLRQLMITFVPLILQVVLHEFQSVMPISTIGLVENLCRLLDALVTSENIPKYVEDESKYIEKYFVFAAIWAFGSGLNNENKRSFSLWCRTTFKNVRMPSKGTVFDYYIKKSEFLSWHTVLEAEEVETKIKLLGSIPIGRSTSSNVTNVINKASTVMKFIHTPDTIAARTIGELVSMMHMNMLLVGASGMGKTALVEEMLHQLPKDYSKARYQINNMSDSQTVQSLLEGGLEKKAGKNFGPINSKYLVFFLDDMNIAAVDPFEAQSGLELIRQVLDYKHWYDREKYTLKILNSTQVIAAMNPARGNNMVSDRLLRHFFVYCKEYPAESLNSILSSTLRSHLESFFQLMLVDDAFVQKLVLSTVEIHTKVIALFHKGIETFHYDFDLRHQLALLDGIKLADPKHVSEIEQLVSLWAYEAERVYRDSLVSESSYVTFDKQLRDVCKRYFKDLEQTTVFCEPLLFSSLWQDGTHLKNDSELTYNRIVNIDQLKGRLEKYIEKSQNEGKAQANLVLFDVTIFHVVKIARLIRMGHALIVSEGGNGKQSLTKLAAYIQGYEVWPLEPSGTYHVESLRNEVKDVYMKVGLRDALIIIVVTESTLLSDEFLVPIHEVLTTGDLCNLFTSEDKDAIHESMVNFAKDSGYDTDRESCFGLFMEKVRKAIRIALCLTPGNKLRQRTTRFPALLTCTQINWIHPWPHEVLKGLAEKLIVDDAIPADTPDVDIKVVATLLASSFEMAAQMTGDDVVIEGQNVRVYLTPKVFIDHIKLFNSILVSERERMSTLIRSMTLVMENIAKSVGTVTELETEMSQIAADIDDKKDEENNLLTEIRKHKVNIEEEQAVITTETENVERLQKALAIQRQLCASVLAEGEPALKSAREAINSIKARDLIELKSNPKSPHLFIEQVLFAMLALREVPSKNHDWPTAKIMLKDLSTITEDQNRILAAIGDGKVEARVITATRAYISKEGFDPKEVQKKNPAAGAMCEAVLSTVRYYDLVAKGQPNLQLLGQMRDEHDASHINSENAKQNMKDFSYQLDQDLSACQLITKAKNGLMTQALDLQKQLATGQRLLTAIDADQKLWKQKIDEMRQSENILLSGAMLASTFVSYLGPLCPKLRKDFVKEFLHGLATDAIDSGKAPDPLRLVASRLLKVTWAQQGLPIDSTAVENAAIVSATMRTPLIIDPHLYLTQWIVAKSSSGKVQSEPVGSKTLKTTLMQAIASGWTLLVELADTIPEPFLLQAAAKQLYEKGGTSLIKIAGKEIEYNPNFRLYLVTGVNNPHIGSDFQAECTLVDCTTSKTGIEEDFLRIICLQRQHSVEWARSDHLKERADLSLKRELLSGQVLEKLLTATGSLFSDAKLIESLEVMSQSREELTLKLDSREDKIEEADKICESYRPLAKRCALLYSIALSLKPVDPLYQFSLQGFKSAILNATVKDNNRPARGYINVPEFARAGNSTNPFMRFRVMASVIKAGTKGILDRGRVRPKASVEDANPEAASKDNESLIPIVTFKVCRFVQRGLFFKDNLLFLVCVTVHNMLKVAAITPKEMQTMAALSNSSAFSSGDSRYAPRPAVVNSFIPEINWQFVCALEEVPGLQKLSHDIESTHERWLRWSHEPQPETAVLPSVYGRTTSPFQKILILRALRPDRLQEGFRHFVSENLGPEYVVDNQEFPLADMYRLSRPRMPLLLVGMAGTEDFQKQLATLCRKKDFGGKTAYLRHGKVDDSEIPRYFTRTMKDGHWLFMYEAEANPVWLTTLDRLLLSSNVFIDGEFRAFILYNLLTKCKHNGLSVTLLTASILMTSEAPITFKANLLKSLAVFDNEHFLHQISNPMEQKKLEDLASALCTCHANLNYRNRFKGLGWTREYDVRLELLEEAGRCIVSFMTGPKTPNARLIAIISEYIYGGQIHDEWDMRIVKQNLHDLLYREPKGSHKSDLLPFLKSKEDMTYGEYMEYCMNNNHLEDTNVVGLSHNAPMLFALPEADQFIGYLTAVLIPGATLNSGGTSVAAASDSIHELLEQLPNNFVLDSIRDDVQKLGSLHEPLGYVLLQEVVQMNVIIDIMRRDLSALKSSLNGHCNISDKMEELLEVLMNKQVPASWLAEAHDSRHGLSKWYIHLLRRVKFLDSWNECLKEGKPSPPSVWLPGLLNPYALVTSVKQMHIRAETQLYTLLEYDLNEAPPWEKLHLLGTITQLHSESDLAHVDPADLPQEGLLVHGLVLEGAAWESATSCLVDQVLQDVHPSVPRVHIKTVTRDKLPPALRFPMLHSNDDDPPYAYECPVYARASRGNSFIFSVHVKSQERATTWLYRAAALIMEV